MLARDGRRCLLVAFLPLFRAAALMLCRHALYDDATRAAAREEV